ncbi:MAG TPA: polysaccharide deacetylase family protein [Syntrophorhabdus sp.]|nr:polysaccharide deacetylase family protein [Syntrophorhabdus sp.]
MNVALVIKRALSRILYSSGLTDNILRRSDRGIIMCYHHVLREDDERIKFLQPGMYVTTKTFDLHIRYLSNHYQFTRLESLMDFHGCNKICAITFDDGWADNYEFAYPILKKYRVPATIFIATNYIGSCKWPWPDRLSYYIHKSSGHEMAAINRIVNDHFPEITKNIILVEKCNKNKLTSVEKIVSFVKSKSYDEISSFMEKVDSYMQHHLKNLEMYHPWLTWKQIKEMSADEISFGAHTHNHVILSSVSLNEAKDEIYLSKKILSQQTGKPITSFSYPNGFYHQGIVDILQMLEFKKAVITEVGTINSSKSMFELKRFLLHNDISDCIPMLAYSLSVKLLAEKL